MNITDESNHIGLVVKSNELINAMVKMSLQGQRFLAYVVSLLDRDAKWERGEPVELEVPVLEFAGMFNIPEASAYRDVKALADILQSKIIKLPPGSTLSGDCVDINIISKKRYRPKEGRLWIRLDEDLVPHLLGLREQFTSYRLKDIYQFNSSHTWRVYELLKQYKSIGQRRFDIDELRTKLGLDGLYYKVNNLIQCVVKVAVEEINRTSDIMAQYSTIKTKRKVTGVLFIIRDNATTKTPKERVRALAEKLSTDTEPTELETVLTSQYKVSAKQAKQLSQLAGSRTNDILEALPRIRLRYEKLEGKRTSLGGYVFKAVKSELTRESWLPV